jgi:hypothetical protein
MRLECSERLLRGINQFVQPNRCRVRHHSLVSMSCECRFTSLPICRTADSTSFRVVMPSIGYPHWLFVQPDILEFIADWIMCIDYVTLPLC